LWEETPKKQINTPSMSLLDAAGVINGDIWCNGAFDFESPLKDLLDSGDYTLEQLLAEDELLQELRGVHPQLIEFFSSEEVIAGLIQYIILPPSAKIPEEFQATEDNGQEGEKAEGKDQQTGENSSETEEKENSKEPGKWLEGSDAPEESSAQKPKQVEKDDLFVRFPYMACEVICCEIKGIIDILVDGTVPSSCNDSNDDDGTSEVKKQKKLSSQLISDDARGKPILDLLFSMLYEAEIGEIDDYRAGYFEKILSILFRHRPKDVAQYLNEGGGKGNVTLMSAMFKHLYSHSLMQIVQRLLLPQPPQPPKLEGADSEGKTETNESEDLFQDTLEGADIDPFDSFRCNWSESEEALQMILDCLVGEMSMKESVQKNHDDDYEEERKLDMYQNSSEVLITIIQNSPLTSVTMRALTTDPYLGKLITAATCIAEGAEFSRHDSRLTYAMNVLESIILQLGGYGSVGTMIYEGEGQGAFESVMDALLSDEHKDTSEDLGGKSESSTSTSSQQQTPPSTTATKNYATPETLIKHLPTMMSSLSNLLIYPGAEQWISPMQFSKTKSQNILGSSRLRIVRLLESLVLLGNEQIDSLLCESSCLEVCLDLFWKFQWCSMLHQSVANLLVHAFEGQNSRSKLQSYFIVRCNLLGRLMYSFWDKEVEPGNIASIISASNIELTESVVGHKDSDSENSPTLSSGVSEKESGSTNDVLPVSDDDVDAAMEQQENEKSDNDDSKISSFRLGYMGHVIIICQALVHACTEENENNSTTIDDPEMMGQHGQLDTHLGGDNGREPLKRSEESLTTDFTSADTSSGPPSSLILANLVKKHPLGKIWQDFVVTSLANETALQTTPLGGFQAPTLGTDPLHMHRPGLEDDGAYDHDNGEAPTLPQRGLLVDGDVIDMDDNDLEVAANMMAGLNLGQVTGNHGDGQAQSNASHQSRYIFDDPLGGGRFGEFDDNDDGDSSSDEEPEIVEGAGGSGAPVMDLFAGNFDAFDDADTGDQSPSWSDFANFDDAFASTQDPGDNQESEEKNKFDSIFGDSKSHDILLDEIDQPLSPDNGEDSGDDPAEETSDS